MHRTCTLVAKVPTEAQGEAKAAFWTIIDDNAGPGDRARCPLRSIVLSGSDDREEISMAGIETVSTPVHAGAEELPFVDFGGGNKLKVIQVKAREGLWVVENIFMAGFETQTHRHTGPAWGYTTSGAWKFKEYDYVYRAGSFVYEPAGSVHNLQCIEDNTQGWTLTYGAILPLDADGNVVSVIDGAASLEVYYALCEAQGIPRPNVLVD